MSYYPDTATFVLVTEGGIDDDTGYPLPSTTETINLTGRYDERINDQLKRVADAQSFAPLFVFYMPLGQPNIPIGAELKVIDASSGIEFKGVVKMFNKGKFNAYALCSNI